MRERLTKQEHGFTLPEMLITMLLMIVVLFALYSIFDMSLKVFGFGNAKVEAADNARQGVAKMEREIRAAYPLDKTNGNITLFTDRGSKKITFGNDLNGNRRIVDTFGSVDANERITYELSGSSPPYTLLRNSEPVVEYVEDVNFTYLTRQDSAPADEATIEKVRMELKILVPSGALGAQNAVRQNLTTDVALRNRGN